MKGYSDLLNLNDTKLGELKTLVYESEDYDKKKINSKNFDLKKNIVKMNYNILID